MRKQIKVLIAGDSKIAAKLLSFMLQEATDIEVIAQARDGWQALQLTKKLQPDLITMDIMMPVLDGIQATRAIMEQCPTPILIISSLLHKNKAAHSFHALQAGALSVIETPESMVSYDFPEKKRAIINAIRTFAEVPVIKRKPQKSLQYVVPPRECPPTFQLLALSASTGGPGALNAILQGLPENFSIPIVITQHITKGFLCGLVSFLQHNTPLKIEIAEHHQLLAPGHVYFAPDDSHLTIKKGRSPIAFLDNSAAMDGFKPSANALFTSIAEDFPYQAIGGLLTGMGQDGAQGLLQMKEVGCYTFAQSEATSVVFGMPGAAVKMKAIHEIMDLEQIAPFLRTFCLQERKQ